MFEISDLQKVPISIGEHPLVITLGNSFAMSGWRQRAAIYTQARRHQTAIPPLRHLATERREHLFTPCSRSVSPSNPHSHSFSWPTRSAACCLASPRFSKETCCWASAKKMLISIRSLSYPKPRYIAGTRALTNARWAERSATDCAYLSLSIRARIQNG